jgi:dCMP deaminase
MSDAVVAYVPVLHEGYRRFFVAHAVGRPLYLIGPELYADYRPLAKDIRALDPALVAEAIDAWGVASSVEVLTLESAAELAAESPSLTLPSEDVSYQVVERFFSRCEVTFDSAFLRWDKRRSVELLRPPATPARHDDPVWGELAEHAEREAGGSIDWWRQVGAAIRLTDGSIRSARNVANPTPAAAYAAGDPRSNFFRGVHLELSTATHAEAALIAGAARDGISTAGATLYVTTFPCPPCAKLIAGAGIQRLYYRDGYAVLDGGDVLEAAGVEIVAVATSETIE